jgi:hypothetical protein
MKKLTNGRVGGSHNSVKSDHRNGTLTGELENINSILMKVV